MRAGSRPSLSQEAFGFFVVITLSVLFLTCEVFSYWLVESQGVWADGQIVSISQCIGRYENHHDVHLSVSYLDRDGYQHVSETGCQMDSYVVGQFITIRYLPVVPWFILTREDIGDGQGRPLLILVVIDAICVPSAVVGLVYMTRAYRRRFAEGVAARQAIAAARGQSRPAARNPAQTRAIRAQRRAAGRRIY